MFIVIEMDEPENREETIPSHILSKEWNIENVRIPVLLTILSLCHENMGKKPQE